MADEITAKEVYVVTRDALRRRSDLGLRKTLAHYLLDPPNLFDPNSNWKPKRWFVFSCMVALAAVVALVYFNFWS